MYYHRLPDLPYTDLVLLSDFVECASASSDLPPPSGSAYGDDPSVLKSAPPTPRGVTVVRTGIALVHSDRHAGNAALSGGASVGNGAAAAHVVIAAPPPFAHPRF